MMMLVLKKYLRYSAVLFLTTSLSVFAKVPLKFDPIPGGLVKVEIPFASKTPPLALFKNIPVAMLKEEDKWYAVIGLPLYLKGYTHNLHIKTPKLLRVQFHTDFFDYKIQRLSITNNAFVDIDEVAKRKLILERENMNEAFTIWTTENPFSKEYIAPVKGWITSTFGLRRYINGKKVPPHDGIDIAAKLYTPVKATASGQVVLADRYLLTGRTVVINHGQGVMSLYAHLERINVHLKQKVKGGKVIGAVGKTGRTTGAHLHFSMIVNQDYINPLFFIAKSAFRPPQLQSTKE